MLRIVLITIFLYLFSTLYAQNRMIKGTVTAKDDGLSMIGVNIIVPRTTNGTTTDFDGNYVIELMPGEDTLVFSFIGYLPFITAINNREIINVILEPDQELLDEVVVVGYGTQKKSDLTGSVSSVRGEDINKIPSASAAQALQGKVSGVQVSSVSGEPGIAPVIRIRGVGTLNNSSPIYVVDGVILDDIAFLNSGDIASIEVLKDASSTAIYGSRGANGVIIITTKRGKGGNGENQTINVSAEFSMQHLANKIDLLSAREFAEVVNVITPGTFNNIDRVDSTDWQDLVFEDYAPLQNYHVSLAGSSGKYNYYFGAGYFLQEGIIPKSTYERLTIKLNNSYTVTKNIKFGTDVTVAPEKKENPAGVVGQLYRAWPTSVPYNDDESFAEVLGAGNPLAAIEYTNSNTETLRGVGTLYGDITFLKDFVFRSSYGFDASFSKIKIFTPAFFISSSQSNALNDLS
ncbi:MAG: SusC/RagA family TonB-linked outer membrane protein, partial [Chitinophagales bacterium]|nr:SusC/RagA family TonB-linked outer membrane protein [Chitinophagales bacterium]